MGGESNSLNRYVARLMTAIENVVSTDKVEANIYGLINDDTARMPRIDPTTNVLEVIDYVHREIHNGDHYFIQGYTELTSTGVLRLKLVVPDSAKRSHFTFKIDSSGITATTLDEGASGGMAGGTPKIPINNDRNSTSSSGMVLTSGVEAATSYVLRIDDDKWGAEGFKEVTAGGGAARENELILKEDTTYLRTFTSGSDANIIQFRADWYEHENVD